MFDFVRSHTKLLQFLLALLVFPSFILFGIQGYSRFNESRGNTVAEVDGHPITKAEWDAAHRQAVERMRARMPNADIKMFDTPEMRQATLDQLVRERVWNAEVNKEHLVVTDAKLLNSINSIPQLATMRTPDGRVDMDKLKALLAAQGMTVAGFEARMRDDLALSQVQQGVTETAFAPGSVARLSIDALLQRREVQVQRFDAKDYLAKVNPSDADLQAYYNNPANQAQFRAPEQAKIDYVVLDLDALKKDITVPEKDARDYYEQNKSRYGTPEERRARHILIKADKDAPAAEKAKAKAKAEQVLAEVKKNPAAFAELAKKYSDDPGSKDNGGELGFFNREAMVKPFSDAAFALKPNEISNVVESDYGYHIIQLEETRGGNIKPFEAVKADIENEIKTQLAQKRFSEVAEQFSNMVYEQSDSLQPVIDKFKLEKKTTTVGHAAAPAGNGVISSQKFIDAVFGNDALRNKRNTEAVETAPYTLAAAHVLQYSPAHLLPFAEVKDHVRELVVQTQAAAMARKDGEARLAQLKQGGDASGLPAPVVISRAKPEGQPKPLVDAVLNADAAKLPGYLGVDLGNEGYAVVRLDKVLPPDANDELTKSLTERYAAGWGAAEAQSYYESLKKRFKTEVKPDALKSSAESPDAAASR
jgi:peptidyl-prolyl cis-trans isomerase D